MSQIDRVFRAIEFIEDNLREAVLVADIAEAVSYSLYHFCRVFNQVVHHSPYNYLMRRRLSEAAYDLIKTNKKITDIAFDYQFNSPETFSRAFKRMFGLQPNQWKKRGNLDRRFLMMRLTPVYLQHINQGTYLKPVLAQKNSIKVTGLMTYVKENKRDVILKLWNVMMRELDGIDGIRPENYYGVTWYPSGWGQCGFFYLAAIEAKQPDVFNYGFVTKTIPLSTCAKFLHKGPWHTRQLTLDYIYQTWLPKSGRCLAYPMEIEYFKRNTTPITGAAETEIYILLN